MLCNNRWFINKRHTQKENTGVEKYIQLYILINILFLHERIYFELLFHIVSMSSVETLVVAVNQLTNIFLTERHHHQCQP